MRCGQLVSIDFDVAMANNFTQAVFIFRNRKIFLNEETYCNFCVRSSCKCFFISFDHSLLSFGAFLKFLGENQK